MSSYTLDIHLNTFPVYHASELKPHYTNDSNLFPSRVLAHPGPIVTKHSLEEFTVNEILDSRSQGCRWQFLVCWSGYAAEHDLWIATSKLNECEALDKWYQAGRDGPDMQ